MTKTLRLCLAALALSSAPATAQAPAPATEPVYTVEATYGVTLLGLSVGSMRLSYKMQNGQWEVRSYIQPEGLARTFASNTINAVANGRGQRGTVEAFYSWIQQQNSKKTQIVEMFFTDDTAREVNAQPVYEVGPDTPTPAQYAGGVDPMTGLARMMLMADAGAGDKACGSVIPIYDGKRVYAFDMWSEGMIQASRGTGGYNGPVLSCVASYRRIAGWDAARLAKGTSTRVHAWFAPIGKGADGGPAFYLPVRLWGDAEVGDVVAIPSSVTINGKPWGQFFADGG